MRCLTADALMARSHFLIIPMIPACREHPRERVIPAGDTFHTRADNDDRCPVFWRRSDGLVRPHHRKIFPSMRPVPRPAARRRMRFPTVPRFTAFTSPRRRASQYRKPRVFPIVSPFLRRATGHLLELGYISDLTSPCMSREGKSVDSSYFSLLFFLFFS